MTRRGMWRQGIENSGVGEKCEICDITDRDEEKWEWDDMIIVNIHRMRQSARSYVKLIMRPSAIVRCHIMREKDGAGDEPHTIAGRRAECERVGMTGISTRDLLL